MMQSASPAASAGSDRPRGRAGERSVAHPSSAVAASVQRSVSSSTRRLASAWRCEDRAAVAESKRLEREIERAERELRELEVELADPAAWNDPRTAAKSSHRHAEAKRAVEELVERWEAAALAEGGHR